MSALSRIFSGELERTIESRSTHPQSPDKASPPLSPRNNGEGGEHTPQFEMPGMGEGEPGAKSVGGAEAGGEAGGEAGARDGPKRMGVRMDGSWRSGEAPYSSPVGASPTTTPIMHRLSPLLSPRPGLSLSPSLPRPSLPGPSPSLARGAGGGGDGGRVGAGETKAAVVQVKQTVTGISELQAALKRVSELHLACEKKDLLLSEKERLLTEKDKMLREKDRDLGKLMVTQGMQQRLQEERGQRQAQQTQQREGEHAKEIRHLKALLAQGGRKGEGLMVGRGGEEGSGFNGDFGGVSGYEGAPASKEGMGYTNGVGGPPAKSRVMEKLASEYSLGSMKLSQYEGDALSDKSSDRDKSNFSSFVSLASAMKQGGGFSAKKSVSFCLPHGHRENALGNGSLGNGSLGNGSLGNGSLGIDDTPDYEVQRGQRGRGGEGGKVPRSQSALPSSPPEARPARSPAPLHSPGGPFAPHTFTPKGRKTQDKKRPTEGESADKTVDKDIIKDTERLTTVQESSSHALSTHTAGGAGGAGGGGHTFRTVSNTPQVTLMRRVARARTVQQMCQVFDVETSAVFDGEMMKKRFSKDIIAKERLVWIVPATKSIHWAKRSADRHNGERVKFVLLDKGQGLVDAERGEGGREGGEGGGGGRGRVRSSLTHTSSVSSVMSDDSDMGEGGGGGGGGGGGDTRGAGGGYSEGGD